jgi:hypothetical protein
MSDRWLTVEAAAKRVDRSKDTIYRWQREELLSILLGRVLESQLLEVDALKRKRRGRPKKPRSG